MIQIGNKTYHPPTSWNDLSLSRLLGVYGILAADIQDATGMSPVELSHAHRIMLTQFLLDITDEEVTAWKADRLRKHGKENGELIFLAEMEEVTRAATAGLLDIDGDAFQVKPELTRCPHPVITGIDADKQKVTLYGPAAALENITFYELTTIFSLYEAFAADQTAENASTLLATVYRPPKPATPDNLVSDYHGDIRLPYRQHETTVAQRAQYFLRVPPIVRGLLIFWIGCCRQDIVNRYANLFIAPEENANKVGNDYGWAAVLLNLAGGIVNLNDVADQNFHNALIWMSLQEDQRKLDEFRLTAAAAKKSA